MFGKFELSGFADEIDPNLDKQLEVLKALGMNYIEMRGVDGVGLDRRTVAEAKEIRRRLDAAGIRVSCLGAPIGKIGIRDDFPSHFEHFKHVAEMAGIMGTRNIHMFSFIIPKGEKPEKFRSEVMERVGHMADYAKEAEVILLNENGGGTYGDTAAHCLEIMRNFYGDHFKTVFDFANFVQCGQDTLEAYNMLRPYVSYVHIKDARSFDGTVVPPGHGDGYVEEILRKLRDSGYQGFLSLESSLKEYKGLNQPEQGGDCVLQEQLTGTQAFTLGHDSLLQIMNRL